VANGLRCFVCVTADSDGSGAEWPTEIATANDDIKRITQLPVRRCCRYAADWRISVLQKRQHVIRSRIQSPKSMSFACQILQLPITTNKDIFK